MTVESNELLEASAGYDPQSPFWIITLADAVIIEQGLQNFADLIAYDTFEELLEEKSQIHDEINADLPAAERRLLERKIVVCDEMIAKRLK